MTQINLAIREMKGWSWEILRLRWCNDCFSIKPFASEVLETPLFLLYSWLAVKLILLVNKLIKFSLPKTEAQINLAIKEMKDWPWKILRLWSCNDYFSIKPFVSELLHAPLLFSSLLWLAVELILHNIT